MKDREYRFAVMVKVLKLCCASWEDRQKYITYNCPDGKKCKYNKMHEQKEMGKRNSS